jgi:hypothetical protein
MNPLTIEWVEKAEEDYNVLRREIRDRCRHLLGLPALPK